MATESTETSGGLGALREENARRVLRTLLANPGGETQVEIGRASRLARSTVSVLLSETLGSVLDSTERDEGLRGPAPQVWSVARDAAFSVGIDIGKSHVTAALADPYGALVGTPESFMMSTTEDPGRVFDVARDLVKKIVGTPSKCRRIAAVMVGLPGIADRCRGSLRDPAATEWEGFDVEQGVIDRWPFDRVPSVYIENDANLGALGELNSGAGRGAKSLLFIKWSTGIGSGLVLNEQLWRGKSGGAGELGHLAVHPTDADRRALGLSPRNSTPRCPRCGQRDCLEQVAGGAAIASAIGAKDFRAVVREADEPDQEVSDRARLALNAAAKLIGTAIGPVLAMLNLERVIVGGIGGRDAYPLVVESIRRGVDQTAPPQARDDAVMKPSELGDMAYVVGAAASGFEVNGINFLYARAGSSAELSKPQSGTLLAS